MVVDGQLFAFWGVLQLIAGCGFHGFIGFRFFQEQVTAFDDSYLAITSAHAWWIHCFADTFE